MFFRSLLFFPFWFLQLQKPDWNIVHTIYEFIKSQFNWCWIRKFQVVGFCNCQNRSWYNSTTVFIFFQASACIPTFSWWTTEPSQFLYSTNYRTIKFRNLLPPVKKHCDDGKNSWHNTITELGKMHGCCTRTIATRRQHALRRNNAFLAPVLQNSRNSLPLHCRCGTCNSSLVQFENLQERNSDLKKLKRED